MYGNRNFEPGRGRNPRGASRSCVVGKEGGEGVVDFETLAVVEIGIDRKFEDRRGKEKKEKTQCSGFGVPKIRV